MRSMCQQWSCPRIGQVVSSDRSPRFFKKSARRLSSLLVILLSSVVSPLVIAQTNDSDCATGSCLRVSAFGWDSSSCSKGLSLTVSGTETGHLYDVFYADSLVPPVKWKIAEKGIVALGTDFTWTDCGSPNRLPPSAVSSRFYTAGIGDDTDGDGLGDAYEVLVLHTDPNQSHTGNGPLSDGDADFDGDGYSNLQEYNSGTDPTDPNSFPTSVRTYGEFALWSHVNGAITFRAGEVYNGHVHADDEFYFTNAGGGPIFHGPVTSAANVYSGNITGIEFDQGLTLNSYQGSMSDVDFDSAASNSLKNIATNRGLVLQGNTTITFNGGTLSISNTRMGWTNHVYGLFPTQNIIYVANATAGTASTRTGSVYFVGGNVSSRLTIVSEADMTISSNIIYTTDPRINSTSTVALGLISKASVWVALTAPNNLEIDAAIMATGRSDPTGSTGSFGVISYNVGAPRGTLTSLGGIVQEIRGAIGTFNGSGPVSGYARNYLYDTRFQDNPPPYYPVILDQH